MAEHVIVDGYSTEHCDGCRHWRPLSKATKIYCCHYLLDTEKRVVRRRGRCYSRSKKKK